MALKQTAIEPSNPWESYQKHKRRGFELGICSASSRKRHGKSNYEVTQHFMPEIAFPRVALLKKYFLALDEATQPTQFHDRNRYSSIEFFDTAIEILWQVRNHLSVNNPYCIGSKYISGVTWATIGRHDCSLARYRWNSFNELIAHYGDQIYSGRFFNAMNIYRRENLNFNKSKALSGDLDQSESFVLAVAVLFLFDIVKNCGPDSEHFLEVFTNDSRSKHFLAAEKWLPIFKTIVQPSAVLDPLHFGQNLVIQAKDNFYTCSGKPNYNNNNQTSSVYKKCNYSEVEIVDVSSGVLHEGEKIVDKSSDNDRYEGWY